MFLQGGIGNEMLQHVGIFSARSKKRLCDADSFLKMHTFSACSQILLFSLFSALGIKAVGIYGDTSRKVFGLATAASTHLDGGSWPDYSFKKPASLMHMNSLY